MPIWASGWPRVRSSPFPLLPSKVIPTAHHIQPGAYAKKFTGRYEHRTITGGIGHNLPQEAPQAFAEAIIDVDGF